MVIENATSAAKGLAELNGQQLKAFCCLPCRYSRGWPSPLHVTTLPRFGATQIPACGEFEII